MTWHTQNIFKYSRYANIQKYSKTENETNQTKCILRNGGKATNQPTCSKQNQIRTQFAANFSVEVSNNPNLLGNGVPSVL